MGFVWAAPHQQYGVCGRAAPVCSRTLTIYLLVPREPIVVQESSGRQPCCAETAHKGGGACIFPATL